MAESDAFVQRYGPWALVAGASEGLGAAFAGELARRGLNLVLVARRAEPLEKTAGALRSGFGIQVKTVSLDLYEPGFMAALMRGVGDVEIGLLVCDAARAHTGRFLEAGIDEYLRVLDTNCRAPLSLIHHFGGIMAQRGRGGILVMSSLSAFWGSPYATVYGATKAFLLTLSEGLWKELGDRGVSVTVCTAGPILTPNYIAGKPPGSGPSAIEMTPAVVAGAALAGLGRVPLVVPGTLNKFARFLMGRLLTRKAATRMLGNSTGAIYERSAKSR